MMKTYHIISNPIAGKNKAKKNVKIVESVLQERGVNFCTHYSHAVGDATQIVKALTLAGETEIVALGGDGTLHEVLNGIADTSVCNLGLIPSGTGNDFAEKIGISLDAKKAVETILDGEAKDTDFLEVGGVRCMNVAGLGIDVDVLERCKRGKMKGKLKYLMSLVRSLFTYKGCEMEICVGETKETRKVLIATACNGAQFGGGIKICPTAQVDDGEIDAIIVDCIGGKWNIVKAFIALLKGKILQYPLVKHITCDSLRFCPQKPCTVQLDGELYKDLQFNVKLCKGLRFYRP